MVSVHELPDLGAYEPLFRIGAGGMGEVYAARRRSSLRAAELVAVKRLFPHLVEDKRFVDMLLDEARITHAVSSPHVVRVLDTGKSADGVPYFVMELVAGCDLAQLMGSKKPVPIDAVLEWIAQAAEGLHAAHETCSPEGESLGLVHRDVSPENVLIGVDGLARISDFGVAYARERIQQATAEGRVKGKLGYMSPEQTHAAPLDRRSDIFSLGIVAWEALTWQHLFDAKSSPAIVQQVREQVISPPHHLRTDLSREASAVVLKALERDPQARYATALEFATALRGAAKRRVEPHMLARLVQEHSSAGPLNTIREGLTATWPQALAPIEQGRVSRRVPALSGSANVALGIMALCGFGLLAYFLTH